MSQTPLTHEEEEVLLRLLADRHELICAAPLYEFEHPWQWRRRPWNKPLKTTVTDLAISRLHGRRLIFLIRPAVLTYVTLTETGTMKAMLIAAERKDKGKPMPPGVRL